MDVGDPSNFIRIRELYNNDFDQLKAHLKSASYTDDATRKTLKKLYVDNQYLADPHGAVGYMGLKSYLATDKSCQGIFLETAHPVKFLDVVEPVIGKKIDIPTQIEAVLDKKSEALSIASYKELKTYLLS